MKISIVGDGPGGFYLAILVKKGLTWYVTSRAAYLAEGRVIGAAYRAAFGAHCPAMAVIEVSALMEAEALVEIEGTAVIADR